MGRSVLTAGGRKEIMIWGGKVSNNIGGEEKPRNWLVKRSWEGNWPCRGKVAAFYGLQSLSNDEEKRKVPVNKGKKEYQRGRGNKGEKPSPRFKRTEKGLGGKGKSQNSSGLALLTTKKRIGTVRKKGSNKREERMEKKNVFCLLGFLKGRKKSGQGCRDEKGAFNLQSLKRGVGKKKTKVYDPKPERRGGRDMGKRRRKTNL